MEDLSEENLKFLSDSHLEEINDELIVPNTSKNNHPFKCVLCPLKFSNMEGAKTHFQYDHEKQNVLSKKPVKIQTSELGSPCDEQLNEKPKDVEIEEFPKKIQTSELGNPWDEQVYEKQKEDEVEELPRVVGQIVKVCFEYLISKLKPNFFPNLIQMLSSKKKVDKKNLERYDRQFL